MPVCSRPAFAVSGSSAEIDRLVKERVRDALSLYELDVPLIRALQPTHILTQTQCKVCAVSLDDVKRAARENFGCETEIVSLEPYALADVWLDIQRVANACGCSEKGKDLNRRLQDEISTIRERAQRTGHPPRVAAIEWLEPLMASGNWVPELIELAGGINLFGQAGGHSPWMTWDDLRSADPDVIVALPCGFDLQRTRSEMHWLETKPDWDRLRAVRSGTVFLCDGNQFMNRPGPRLVESLRIFAELFHPNVFPPTLQGFAWQRL